MKTLLVLIVTVYVVYVTSETCDESNFSPYTDCQQETCGDNMHRGCLRGVCTCLVNVNHYCLTRDDCLHFNGSATACTGLSYHLNRPRVWHCEDNKCLCF